MWRLKQIRELTQALLVCVFATLGSLPQLALCTGAAGHHAIELRGAACCDPVAAPGYGPTVEAVPSECPPDCSDLPLGVVAAAQRPDGPHHTVTGAYLPPISSVVLENGGFSSGLGAWPILPVDYTLRALRSTVALC
jgi:hypothetical protein